MWQRKTAVQEIKPLMICHLKKTHNFLCSPQSPKRTMFKQFLMSCHLQLDYYFETKRKTISFHLINQTKVRNPCPDSSDYFFLFNLLLPLNNIQPPLKMMSKTVSADSKHTSQERRHILSSAAQTWKREDELKHPAGKVKEPKED